MTQDEIRRLSHLGNEKIHTPLLYLVNITYDMFIHISHFTLEDYNKYMYTVMLSHPMRFIFYDDVTKKLYSMVCQNLRIHNMIPRDNLNPLQQTNYEVYGNINNQLQGEEPVDRSLMQWYRQKRSDFLKYGTAPGHIVGSAIDENGNMVPADYAIAEDIDIEDYCDIANLMTALMFMQEIIFFAMVNKTRYKVVADGRLHYFDQEDLFWASMITIDSGNRMLEGFRRYDETTGISRKIITSFYVDYHQRSITPSEKESFNRLFPNGVDEDAKIIVIDDTNPPVFNFIELGVLNISDMTM